MKEITMDQNQFVSALQTIEHPPLSTGVAEEKGVPEFHELYRSLLGALAYAPHTGLM